MCSEAPYLAIADDIAPILGCLYPDAGLVRAVEGEDGRGSLVCHRYPRSVDTDADNLM